MACNTELVQYIVEQCSGAGEIHARKMFGDYGIYCNGKIFGLICDNQLFIKITDVGKEMNPDLQLCSPYDGAKLHFLFSDIDNAEALSAFVHATCEELTTTKQKKKKVSFDYKKEYKEIYRPSKKPGIIEIPSMNYIAVQGKGNPNEVNGEYQDAIRMLYGVAYTLKMSYKGEHQIEGYFPYIVPPLEGLWWQSANEYIDYSCKESFEWISMIRLPDFIKKEDFEWAIANATEKKKADFSKVEYFTYKEGLCVQCMHIGSYDEEPITIAMMNSYVKKNGYQTDFSSCRHHHEIYLSDPRKCAPENCKTVIRHPIKKI